ncbi:MAG: LLM class flavin-dependent oxidoreductase [Chloroflexi bacterium]|nr:LLM class flavin-dependent oxidoreductase [Chloroflexota bacterium]
MPRTGFAISTPMLIQDLVDVAKAAELHGYESFWLTEGTGNSKDAISQLSVLARETRAIKLATGIVHVWTRSAPIMAMTAASLDEISGGRFILGLGTGHRASVERIHGIPFTKPLARTRDYTVIIKRALAGELVDYQGESRPALGFRLSYLDVLKDHQPKVPVYIAALGPQMAEMAGEVADGIVPYLATPEHIRELVNDVRAGLRKAGRPSDAVDIACFIIACASPDQKAAFEEARRQLALYSRAPFYQNVLKRGGYAQEVEAIASAWASGDVAKATKAVPDRMVESLALVGTAAQWHQTLKRFRDAGVTLPIVYALPVGSNAKASILQALGTPSVQ